MDIIIALLIPFAVAALGFLYNKVRND